MRRLALVTLFVLVSAVPSFAQSFDLAALGLGANVTPVAIESDALGIKMVIVWKALGGSHAFPGFYLINPRRAGSLGAFCFEPVNVVNDPQTNPNVALVPSTVTVGGRLMLQFVDQDGSDGITPWWLVAPEFVWCK